MAQETVTVDGRSSGRTFDGVGAISAGASSRLLVDYPEPERSQILDYLFTPAYGCSLQLLKVEIGSGANSTAGSEPSHMREPGEVDCSRGYEWWLMKQAKRRNPDITLAALEWGAPGWFEGGFWSRDNIDYILAWLECAERHGLRIDYVGGWNERGFDPDWYVALGKALEERFPYVRIVADDGTDWDVASALARRPEFREAVDVVGVHFACGHRTTYESCSSPRTARDLGKPLWMSENSAMSPDAGAGPIARALNRMYVDARLTGYLSWSAVSAWYANLPLAGTGLVLAEWPWSGYYVVGKSVWVYAHTTQFVQPGWTYLDSASGYLTSGASYVTLASPGTTAFSTIVETVDADQPTDVYFRITGGLPDGAVYVWHTDLGSSGGAGDLAYVGAVEPEGGEFSLTLAPNQVYTLSTTTGQRRGTAAPAAEIGDRMALPYREDFESLRPGDLARYFSDVNGTFEAAPCAGDRPGMCYRQVVDSQPIPWNQTGHMDPTTLVGDPRWWGNYEVSVGFLLERPGYVELVGRVSSQRPFGRTLGGYHLRVASDGAWRLYSADPARTDETTLASGRVTPPGAGTWHTMALSMRGETIAAGIDGAWVARVADRRQTSGNVALRTSAWDPAQFDDLVIVPTSPQPDYVPQQRISAYATSAEGFYRGAVFPARFAVDDRPETLWHSEFRPERVPPPHAVTLDLGGVHPIEALAVRPRPDAVTSAMITDYEIHAGTDGEHFTEVTRGSWPVSSATKTASWPTPVRARFVRLVATGGVGGMASAAEINVVRAD